MGRIRWTKALVRVALVAGAVSLVATPWGASALDRVKTTAVHNVTEAAEAVLRDASAGEAAAVPKSKADQERKRSNGN